MDNLTIASELVAAAKVFAADPRFKMERKHYIPPDVPTEIVDPQGTDVEIVKYESAKNGKLFGIAFAGKSNKPLWHYSFRTEESRQKQIDETIESRKKHMEFKQKQQEEFLPQDLFPE